MGILAGKGIHELRGERVKSKRRHELWRHIGMVFQNPSDQLFTPSCREEVAFGPRQLGLSKAQIEERVFQALDAVGLRGFEQRVPHHLSSGERKRLAIASVLSMRPRVLILDEPTANLDPASEEALFEIIHQLDVTKIIISHDIPLIMALCERTVVLHKGRIIRDYSSNEFQHDDQLFSINGLDYTYRNTCHQEIIALQNGSLKGPDRLERTDGIAAML
jgi:energy-coupling factor transporter ATP-binding protein EcfA2